MIIVVSYVGLSIVFKLKSFKIQESLSISPRIRYHSQSHIVFIECAAIIIIINVIWKRRHVTATTNHRRGLTETRSGRKLSAKLG